LAVACPQSSACFLSSALIVTELFKVFERELRVGVPIALLNDLGVDEGPVFEEEVAERSSVLVLSFPVVFEPDLLSLA
jgi:hypothetical protein